MGTRYTPIISFITNKNISDASYANNIAGALYKNKFENLETPTRTGTVSVNCSVYTAGQIITEKSSDLVKYQQ